MRLRGARQIGAAVANRGAQQNDRGALLFAPRGHKRASQALAVEAIHLLYVPALGGKAGRDVFGEGDVGGAIDRDAVVVVEIDQVAEP